MSPSQRRYLRDHTPFSQIALVLHPTAPCTRPHIHTNNTPSCVFSQHCTMFPSSPRMTPQPSHTLPFRKFSYTLTSPTMSAPSATLSSTNPTYDVFISHAGEDKATVAFPLRESLIEHGITSFVDETDIEPGADAQQSMIDAMETAKVAVIVLSPEFVARKWPIKELMCFLRRVDQSFPDDRNTPKIIPVFYRLTIEDLYHEPRFDRRDKDGNRLYEKSRFFDRMKNGEPEASISNVEGALRKLHGFMGVRNDFDASNDSSALMNKRRKKLLEELCKKVREAVPGETENNARDVNNDITDEQHKGSEDGFRRFFPTKSRLVPAVLDFNNRMTPESLLKQLLLDETSDSRSVFSIHGIGGVGKSTIVRALCLDNEIRRRFLDGIHLLKLGKDATTTVLLHQICQVLKDSGAQKESDDLRMKNNIDETLLFFERWFEGKRCAFVIDDAWEHVMDLSILSRLSEIGNGVSGNSVLITTRELEIASLAPDENIIPIAPREARGLESQQILFFHADCQEMELCTASFAACINEVLDICAGLPLSLTVAGKGVKKMRTSMQNDNEGAWKRYLSRLLISRDKLWRTDVVTSWGKYENLFATIASSLSFLDEKPREETLGFKSSLSFVEKYRRLCVLQKQALAPPSMLKHLWEVASEEYADVVVTTFVEMGLASHEALRIDGESVWCLSLHDSLHDFALADAKTNGLIEESHECLLNGYKSRDPDVSCELNGTLKWWSRKLESDGYIHRNLCRHLLEAGRVTELFKLLLCPQWAERQVSVTGIAFLESDLLLGVKSIEHGMRDENDQERPEVRTALELIAEAVALSSGFIGNNIAELHFQVHGRLKGSRERCSAIEEYVTWIEAKAGGPKILCENSFLREPGGMNTRIIPIGVPVECMAVMKGGARVACGCKDGRIFILDARRGVIERHWEAHDNMLKAIAVSKDGTRLVSGSLGNVVKVWNVDTGGCVSIFKGHSKSVSGVAVLGDGRRVFSASEDGSAYLWDLETAQILLTVFVGRRRIRCVSMLGDGEATMFTGRRRISCVAMLGDRGVAVMGGYDGKLIVGNLSASEQAGDTFNGHQKEVTSVAVTPDGNRLASGSWDRTLRVWDVGSRQQIGDFFMGDLSFVRYVAVSEDGRRIISASRGDKNLIRVWDVESGTQICEALEGHTNYVSGVSFLASADHIVSSSWDGTIRVWDVTREGKKKSTNRRHESIVTGVSFTPDGEFGVSASFDESIRIWNATSGQQVGDSLWGHSDIINDVTVTPDGRSILSVSDDKTLRVWDFESHELLHTFTGHLHGINCVAVTPQGDFAVTGSYLYDKTIRVWDLAAKDGSHFVLKGHRADIKRVFVSDDGLRIISVDEQDNIFVWNLQTKELDRQFEKVEDSQKMSRREILNLARETTVHDDTALSIPWGRKIVYGKGPDVRVLATMDAEIHSWALSPDKKKICVGLGDGQVGFLKLVT